MKFPKIPKFKLPKILPDGKFAKFMHIVGRLCQKLLCVLEWIGDRIRGIFGVLMKWLKTLIVRVLGFFGKKTPKGVFYVGGADILPPPLSKEEEQEMIARLGAEDSACSSSMAMKDRRASR